MCWAEQPQISIKQITLPRMTPKELEQAIQLDIGDILKLPANGDTQSVYHSYEVLNQGEELDVLVVGCTRHSWTVHRHDQGSRSGTGRD